MRIFLFLMPILAFASDGHDYDIIARTINFLLFAGILYYFIANPIKSAYKNRISTIENKLNSVRDKVLAAEEKVRDAKDYVVTAREKAEELVQIGKKQAAEVAIKIGRDAQNEVSSLEESFKEQKEFAQRSATQNAVNQVIAEIFADESIKVKQDDLVNLVIKKVG